MSKYPAYLSPSITPTSFTKSGHAKQRSSRSRREPSGVFQLFSAPQIQLFKEAFSLIDQDGDGVVGEADLKGIFANLGLNLSQSTIDSLLSARPGSHANSSHIRMASTEPSTPQKSSSNSSVDQDKTVNFAMFLTMMGERLFEFDAEQELMEAFECFDENDSGVVKVDEMRRWLGEVGERMGGEEIDRLLKGPFTDRQGNFKYREWIKVVRVNDDKDEGDEGEA